MGDAVTYYEKQYDTAVKVAGRMRVFFGGSGLVRVKQVLYYGGYYDCLFMGKNKTYCRCTISFESAVDMNLVDAEFRSAKVDYDTYLLEGGENG